MSATIEIKRKSKHLLGFSENVLQNNLTITNLTKPKGGITTAHNKLRSKNKMKKK